MGSGRKNAEEDFSIIRMRTNRPLSLGPTESTPVPGRQKCRNPRLAELQEEHDALNETLAISFNGNENLDSPFFDRSKSTSYYNSCFEVIEPLGSGCFAAVYKCRQKEDGKLDGSLC
ncbi:uncharacterized protein LOC108864737 [Galendromus occidentalis]|uniref:Uncharacterized protein LOC108864737 n=1 Tax=Galendromus occidentalis TaxID=34638 RepID=A0AAJ7L727_9ACAR|nr:uncharacterized protein LOC108864737 [Galendromus occidentalis]